MEMNTKLDYSIGFGVGILIGLLLVAIVRFLLKKKGIWDCKYDERQFLARGKAFKYGFFIIVFYFMAVSVLQLAFDNQPVKNYVVNFIGVCLGIFVFAANAIWNDAYVSMQNSVRTYVLILLVGGIVNLLLAFLPTLLMGELLSSYLLNLMVGCMSLSLILVFAAKRFKDKKQEETEVV